jgi:hypothetical protein
MERKHKNRIGLVIAIILGVTVALGFFHDKTKVVEYSSKEFGVSFLYPSEYVLTERDIDRTHRVHHAIALINKADIDPKASEGPRAITLDIFQNNLDKQTALGFITGSSDSNYKLGPGNIATTTHGVLEGLEYTWSGLYEGRSFVVSTPEYIYLFAATRIDPQDRIIADFDRLLKTVVISNVRNNP